MFFRALPKPLPTAACALFYFVCNPAPATLLDVPLLRIVVSGASRGSLVVYPACYDMRDVRPAAGARKVGGETGVLNLPYVVDRVYDEGMALRLGRGT
ncbi:MAG: hypothetical protein JWM26_2659 [Betaproteobacteria bacterium]|nr:hypothetical protein [Betaproteobacteria bacterium]